MSNVRTSNVDLQEIPAFTIKETSDCISAIANAIAIGIKQNTYIRDVHKYISNWCMHNSMPEEIYKHMLDVASHTLTSLGYE